MTEIMALQKQAPTHRRDSNSLPSDVDLSPSLNPQAIQATQSMQISNSIDASDLSIVQAPVQINAPPVMRPSSANLKGIENAKIGLQTADWAGVREIARKSILGLQNNIIGESLEILEELSEVSQTLGLSGGGDMDLAANLGVEEKLFVMDRLLVAQGKFNETVAKNMQTDIATPIITTLGNQIAALQGDIGIQKVQQDDLRSTIAELDAKLNKQIDYTKSLEKTVLLALSN